jgi:hypothetical protein
MQTSGHLRSKKEGKRANKKRESLLVGEVSGNGDFVLKA